MGMKNEKKPPKITALQRIIRILILVIFVLSLLIATGRLMEWNKRQHELEELERQKQETQETSDD